MSLSIRRRTFVSIWHLRIRGKILVLMRRDLGRICIRSDINRSILLVVSVIRSIVMMTSMELASSFVFGVGLT